MPTANDILSSKGFSIYVIPSTASVLEAVARMNQLRVGAVLVMDEGRLKGMFTERDVLMRVMGQQLDPKTTRVADVMTRDVICCGPGTDIDEISMIMKNKRVRHLPVCDSDQELLGMISIGDVNAFHASHQEAQLSYLSEYVYGRA